MLSYLTHQLYLMLTQSSLYEQSQQEITDIIDYIPIQSHSNLPSLGWQLNQHLHHSQIADVNSSHLERPHLNAPHSESVVVSSDQPTTSIMQGHSQMTIEADSTPHPSTLPPSPTLLPSPTPLPSLTLRMPHRQLPETSTKSNSNQVSHYLAKAVPKAKSISSRQSSRSNSQKERSRLLYDINSSFRTSPKGKSPNKEELLRLRKEKGRLMREILQKLDGSRVNREVSVRRGEEGSMRKSRKWVEAKNALREAALNSSQDKLVSAHKPKLLNLEDLSITKVTSQWKTVDQPHKHAEPPRMLLSTHKSFPKEDPQEDVFTFANLNPTHTPLHFLPKHVKNVSIEVEQAPPEPGHPHTGCVLCKIIGKRCSFH